MATVRPRDAGVLIGNNLLLVLVAATVFVVPLFPASVQWLAYNLAYTGIYLLAAVAIERHRRVILLVALSAVALEWVSDLLGLPLVTGLAGAVNVFFFFGVVTMLIAQIARSKRVTGRLIVEAINGYLMLGLVFAALVIQLAAIDPVAYSFGGEGASPPGSAVRASDCFYYTFVTYTTVGYGDLLPMTPQAKSLASLVGMAGQLYLAVILAMLVGKFSSTSGEPEEPEET